MTGAEGLRVLVLGDSVPMSRASAGQSIRDAWPQRVAAMPEVELMWHRARGAATSLDVLAEARHLASYVEPGAFDVAVVQVGIVDVCPRPFSRRVQRVIDLSPKVRSAVQRLYPQLLRLRARPWLAGDAFSSAMTAAVDSLAGYARKIVIIEIAAPGAGLVAKAGDFSAAVLDYNEQLVRLAADRDHVTTVRSVRPEHVASHLLPDGHHLTLRGHQAIFDALAPMLRALAARGPRADNR